VCLVRALLAVEVDFGVASLFSWALIWITLRIILRCPFALKLFIEAQASMRVPSIEKCSVDKSRFTLGRSSTAHKKPAATSPSRSRSRFLEKVE
jgi:hypothetical protein